MRCRTATPSQSITDLNPMASASMLGLSATGARGLQGEQRQGDTTYSAAAWSGTGKATGSPCTFLARGRLDYFSDRFNTGINGDRIKRG